MSLSEELYKEVIIDHSANPRCNKNLSDPTHSEDGNNPLCGDECHLELIVKDDTITEVGVVGEGCSISKASASIMAESIQGLTTTQAKDLMVQLKSLLVEGQAIEFPAEYEDIQALEGVKQYPVRIKCAVLAWNTLGQALQKTSEKN